MAEEREGQELARGGVAPPSKPVSDYIWLIIVAAFAVVFVGGFAVLAAGTFVIGDAGLVEPARVEQMAVVAASFLSGLLAGAVAPAVLRR